MVSQHNDITQSNERFDVHSELTSREEVRGPEETLTPHQDKTLNFTEFIDILSTLPNVPLFQMLNQLPGRGDSSLGEIGSRPPSWNSGIFVGSTGTQAPPSPEQLG